MTGPVLFGASGDPEPSAEVVRRLQGIHAGLHLRFLKQSGEHWAVCMRWPETDRRWESIQTGVVGLDRAYDIIGYLPIGCTAGEAPAYLERMFRAYPKDEVRNMADAVLAHNFSAPVDAAVEVAKAAVLDMTDPFVAPATPAKRGRRK